jgi:hypothetical protein
MVQYFDNVLVFFGPKLRRHSQQDYKAPFWLGKRPEIPIPYQTWTITSETGRPHDQEAS